MSSLWETEAPTDHIQLKRFTWPEPRANFPKLQQVTNESLGKRHYVLPDGSTAISITTLIGRMSDKRHLVRWKKRVGEAEATRITQAAAVSGKSHHSICEDYLHNKLDLSKLDPFEMDNFEKVKASLDRIDNIRCVETSMFSRRLRVAGQTDVIADFDGELSVIDHKTSIKEKKEEWIYNYFLQEAGYAEMFYEHTGVRIKKIVTIISCRGLNKAQVFVKSTEDYLPALEKMVSAYYAQPQEDNE